MPSYVDGTQGFFFLGGHISGIKTHFCIIQGKNSYKLTRIIQTITISLKIIPTMGYSRIIQTIGVLSQKCGMFSS